jgi:NADH-ubiquinone oxidoreductase-G iron-sulfur binding region/2Fe-2S iron-sulfur cluster binding domain
MYINHKIVLFSEEYTLIQLCTAIGIHLPRFCYHSSLPIAANCRMCLIQFEESLKPIAACAITPQPNMRVLTETSLVKQAREAVLEFLLINHPLDCPICDQGGECDLQDQTVVFGSDRGRFYEAKRAVKDFNLGPIVKTQMTRCIHCTRCIRFSQDVLKTNDLGLLGRGSSMKIAPFISSKLSSKLSGNLADICPVGALTSKPYAFTARPWELIGYGSIDLSDAFGANIRIDVRGQEIMRVLPNINYTINEEWITDKARHSFEGITRQRLNTGWLSVRARGGSELNRMYEAPLFEALFAFRKIILQNLIAILIAEKNKNNIVIGSVLDLAQLVFINKIKLLGTDASIKYHDESNNLLHLYPLASRRLNFLIFEDLKNLQKSTVLFFGLSQDAEAPLFSFRFARQNEAKILKSLVNTSNLRIFNSDQKTISIKPVLAGKKIVSDSSFFAKLYILVGQSIIARSDANGILSAVGLMSKNTKSCRFCLVPASACIPNILEII